MLVLESSFEPCQPAVLLRKNSKQYTTIETHKGLFPYQRLLFSISTTPSPFQQAMKNVLCDLPNVYVYINDILVSSINEEDHLHNFTCVLFRLSSAGLILKCSICTFATTSVEYLGYIIDNSELYLSHSNVKAIQEAPAPLNVTELRSFLGLVNYCYKLFTKSSKFLAKWFPTGQRYPSIVIITCTF